MSGEIVVTLTPHNLLMAGIVGVTRHIEGIRKQGAHGVNNNKVGWQINCDGACGECAVAKWLGVFWDGCVGNFQAKDVGGKYQVRTTSYQTGHLPLYQSDDEEDMFILVLSHAAPEFTLRGWVWGAEGKRPEYWGAMQPGRYAFWVPQDALSSMSDIPR